MGLAVPHISTRQIQKIIFAPPSTLIQHRIVTKVDQRMSLCDALEAKLRQSRADGDRLLATAVYHLLNHRAGEPVSCPA